MIQESKGQKRRLKLNFKFYAVNLLLKEFLFKFEENKNLNLIYPSLFSLEQERTFLSLATKIFYHQPLTCICTFLFYCTAVSNDKVRERTPLHRAESWAIKLPLHQGTGEDSKR